MGRDTPAQAVDSSATEITPGSRRWSTSFSSCTKAIASRSSRPPYTVGAPIALAARVVEIEHRRHPVYPDPIGVVLARPEDRVRLQEVTHLVAAVVENEGAPLRVRSAGMLMLVERRPIEAGQRPVVARKVRRHPIEDHSDSLAVQVIDELLEVVRGAETRGGREVAGHLIAPRARERMLHHRHQLNVRKAKIGDVRGQLVSQLQVAQRPVALHGIEPPRPQVDLVDRHRPLVRLRRPPTLHPLHVTPNVARAVHDRVCPRHHHRAESERDPPSSECRRPRSGSRTCTRRRPRHPG